ncbi:MAG: hypothetical protein NTZ16_10450 [Verrucomicrobia bacterium]|nr:hypothetical protein [Verrucomicrobiota bacterium]
MDYKSFVFTYRTKAGTFRIQPHKDTFGLFIDYPQGDWDFLTMCVSPDDGVDYVSAQDTGLDAWDSLPSESLPKQIRSIDGWEKKTFFSKP